MKQRQANRSTATVLSWKVAGIRITIVLLLFTVAGLCTLAKNGQYYPTRTSTHQVSTSIKMNVVHSSAELAAEPLEPVARIFVLHPPVRVRRIPVEPPPLIPPLGLVSSTQLRSPPPYHA